MAKHSGDFYINIAKDNGCTVIPGKGDHFKVYPPKNISVYPPIQIIPKHLKGNGTEYAIVKWFNKIGILLCLMGIFACVYGIVELVKQLL